MNKKILECNNYWVYLRCGKRLAVDLNMFYGDGMGDLAAIHDAINSGQKVMVFYQARPNIIRPSAEDVRHPILINLSEIVMIDGMESPNE